MRHLALLAALILPIAASAVGGGDDTPPTPTETTTTCTDGTIWDADSKSCVAPKDARLDDETRYRAAREFAHAGRPEHAIQALAAMADQGEDRVLTYLGFAYRTAGDMARGMAYYETAIARNPDNLMARSYMGQALVEIGDIPAARQQLAEIRMRGGRQTWPEVALAQAIRSGRGYSY